jgi:hypothetical protein
MGRSWLLSSLLHVALAALLWFGLPSWGRPLPAMEGAITVELVSEAPDDPRPPEPAVAALAPEPEREAARPPPPRREPAPKPEPPGVAEPAPEPPPVAETAPPDPPPAPVVEPAPPPEPQVEPPPPPEPEKVAKPEPASEPEPQTSKPESPPHPKPAPKQQAAVEPEPRPQPEAPTPKLQPEPPPKPQVQPKPASSPPPEQAAKPEPPKPEPELKKPAEPPKQDEFATLLRSVEEMDRQRQDDVVKEGSGRSRDAAGRAPTELGEAPLSIGETDAVMRQIGRCWRLPAGIDAVEDMVVKLRIQVRPDRSVYGVEIKDQARLNRDPKFRAVAESARRAVEACSPLSLPPEKYVLWRDIILNFHPGFAISG